MYSLMHGFLHVAHCGFQASHLGALLLFVLVCCVLIFTYSTLRSQRISLHFILIYDDSHLLGAFEIAFSVSASPPSSLLKDPWECSCERVLQSVPKVWVKKKIQYLHRSFIKWAHFFLGDRGYFKAFFLKKTVNRYCFELSLLTSISKCTHFRFFKKCFRGVVPEIIQSFWGHIFPIARGPLDYNVLQKVHALVQFWLIYGIFSGLYPRWPQFFEENYSFKFWPETLAKARSHSD